MDSMRLAASFPKPSSLTIGGSGWSSDRFKKNAAEKPPFFLPRWMIMCVVNTFIVVSVLVVGFGFGGWASINNFIKQVDTFGLFAKCYQCPPKAPVASGKLSGCGAWNILDMYLDVRPQQRLPRHHISRFEERTTFYKRFDRKCLVNASSGHPLESEPGAYKPKNIWDSFKNASDAFYRFSRPHTVIGTALSIVSVSLLAVEKLSDISPLFFTGVLEAVIAALFMNIYIVGLNQLSDIDIDKVNKPYLPLASGEYSIGTGVMIVASFSILSFWLGWIVGSWPLFWALFVSFVLGTAYSIDLPLLRWKRFAVVAAMCILTVRAVIVQLAFFLHMQTHVYKRPAVFSWPLIFATAFMSFFSVVIALFKDIPDIDGDKIFGIRSFSVRLGQRRVFWICISLLEMAYGVALSVGLAACCSWSKLVTVSGHMILAAILWNRAKTVDLKSKAAITSFYMFIWKLFYVEYLLIPFVR